MNVIVTIDGREAIPVRAIPFVTGWSLSTEDLVQCFANCHRYLRFNKMTSHRLFKDGRYERMSPMEWNGLGSSLRKFSSLLKMETRPPEVQRTVREKLFAGLPDGVFVWKDDFMKDFQRIHHSACPEREGCRDMTYSSSLLEHLEFVTKGFEHVGNARPADPNIFPKQNKPSIGESKPGNNALLIGYDDFLMVCAVDDEECFSGFVVKRDGVYVMTPDNDGWRTLTPGEKSILAWHPTGLYNEPALELPCTLARLRWFVAEAGLTGCINEDALSERLDRVAKEIGRQPEDATGIAAPAPSEAQEEAGDAPQEPDAHNEEQQQDKRLTSYRPAGVDRNRILAAFPPKLGQTLKQWSNTLSDPPKWLKGARVSAGKPGTSALWNPAEFAMCLHDKKCMTISKLTIVMSGEFSEWLPEWKKYTASFD